MKQLALFMYVYKAREDNLQY